MGFVKPASGFLFEDNRGRRDWKGKEEIAGSGRLERV